jgi:ribosome-binding protein aMBF1 (putative translation factor)
MGKTINAKELLAERFGKEGSEEREQFREDAFSYYFGEIIKNRRKELNMSQEALAEKVGKKRPYISRLENGEDVRLSNFALLANALGLSIELKPEF